MDTERTKAIDELGALTKKLAPYRDAIAREAAVKKLVRTWPEADKLEPAATKTYAGSKFTVTVGEAEKERKWKPNAFGGLFGLLKKARFLAVCNVTLKAATEAVGDAAVADLVVTERTGPRPLIVAEKAA
jgi:hypothetical protein